MLNVEARCCWRGSITRDVTTSRQARLTISKMRPNGTGFDSVDSGREVKGEVVVVSKLRIKLELAQRSTFKKSVMVKCIGESRKTLPW